MRQCQACQYKLASLARFCGQCGQATGFDLPVLKSYNSQPYKDKINPSKKRKSLAFFAIILFIILVVLCVVFLVVSFLLGENFSGALFIVALVTTLFYFQTRFIYLQRLLKRETKNRCHKCGYRYFPGEKYCEQCGQPF